MFKKILVANRGEIALRVICACKELGIETVAVYSEPDQHSLHVRFADHSVCIGPARSADSYLNIASIISAAEITNAGGKVETVQKMDKRNFSRVANKKHNAGFYVNVIFESNPSVLDQLKHRFAMNEEVFRAFLSSIRDELARRGTAPADLPGRHQLVVRANAIADVPAAEAAVVQALRQLGFDQDCGGHSFRSFCLRLPERNNFRTALEEQNKVGTGGAFFVALLLGLVAIGTAGLQLQTVIARWRDNGVLQALGFTPGQIFQYFGLQLLIILTGGVAIAALVSLLLPAWSPASFLTAAGLAASFLYQPPK